MKKTVTVTAQRKGLSFLRDSIGELIFEIVT